MYRSVAFAMVLILPMHGLLAHDAHDITSIEPYPLDRISQNIYVVHGNHALPNPANRGFMNNPAAIVTRNGVIVVDPGSSREIGKQLLSKVRQVTANPVIAVFNTHVHGDHWLGNQGIRDIYPKVPIYAHRRMIERAKAGEGQEWINLFMEMTQGAVAGTAAVTPTIGLNGGETLKLDGVTLRIHHTGHAHTDHDLMIEVVEDRALFFGDIVNNNDVPNSAVPQDANYKGSIKAIQTMLNGPFTLFIPGHGRSGGRDVPVSSLRFLEKLYALVTRYTQQGQQAFEMQESIMKEMAEYSGWFNFEKIPRVITFMHKEVENENF